MAVRGRAEGSMTDAVLELVRDALRWDFEMLRSRPNDERHTAAEGALPYALAGMLIANGSERTVGGYRQLTPLELAIQRGLFRTTTMKVAQRLLVENPDHVDAVRTHEWVFNKLESGPMKRMVRTDQAINGLRALLSFPPYAIQCHQQGLLKWDDGDAHAALLITYHWPESILKRAYEVTQEDLDAVRDGALERYADNKFLRLVDSHISLAWESQSNDARERQIEKMQQIAEEPVVDDRTRALKLSALSSLMDSGLRLREPALAEQSFEQLKKEMKPEGDIQHRLQSQRAWMATQRGDMDTARELAIGLSNSDQEFVRAESAQILLNLGEEQSARDIFETVSHLVRPSNVV